MLSGYWTPLAALLGKRADKHVRYELVDFYELRHRAAWWMHVELGMPERLVAVQLGHTDGGKLVRELYGHGDHGALTAIDRYLDAPAEVIRCRGPNSAIIRASAFGKRDCRFASQSGRAGTGGRPASSIKFGVAPHSPRGHESAP
jgi:hypothetical protein